MEKSKQNFIVSILIFITGFVIFYVQTEGLLGVIVFVIRLIYLPLLFWAFITTFAYLIGGTHWHIPIITSQGDYDYVVEKNPAFIYRSFKDTHGGEEYVVGGLPDVSLRIAILHNWPFKKLKKNSRWIIKDERGNDVTEKPLSTVDGILYIESIVPTYDKEPVEQVTKESSEREYSDMSVGVEFYD